MSGVSIGGYDGYNPVKDNSYDYLIPAAVAGVGAPAPGLRLFDLGCGNGTVAAHLAGLGWDVTGVDPSESGIAIANARYPNLPLHLGSAYDDLPGQYGTFDRLISLEVAEHVYSPRIYAKTAFDLLKPGGRAVFSTPYHGYLKNLAIALTDGFDNHFTALWDHGHIKFWSIRTFGELLRETGFNVLSWQRIGRIPVLAKSMVAIAERPAA